jgi:hypothetical protein
MTRLTILIVGGYGFFRSRIVELLQGALPRRDQAIP